MSLPDLSRIFSKAFLFGLVVEVDVESSFDVAWFEDFFFERLESEDDFESLDLDDVSFESSVDLALRGKSFFSR